MTFIPFAGVYAGDGRQSSALNSNLVIDATGEKAAQIGYVWNRDRLTKDITRVGFRFGNVTIAGGSGLTCSLQNVNMTAAAPLQPDETQDQTVAIAAGSIASNTWLRTNPFSANRSVAFGEFLAVVWEFDGGGRLGADSIIINSASTNATSTGGLNYASSLKTGGVWTVITAAAPNVILEFSDGTFGCLGPDGPAAEVDATSAFSSTSSPDEYALRFQVPVRCKIDGIMAQIRFSGTAADSELVLYRDTTVLYTATLDPQISNQATVIRQVQIFFDEIELEPGQTYYIALKPGTSTVILQRVLVADNGHLICQQTFGDGREWYQASRVDGGAWSVNNLYRPYIYPRISAIDDGIRARAGLHPIRQGIVG